MTETPKPFNWREYIAIREGDFTPEQVALISRTLDAIARAHDGEGEALIRKAAAQGKIEIQPSGDSIEDHYQPGEAHREPIIKLSFKALDSYFYRVEGKDIPVPLVDTITHELFHKAAPADNSGFFDRKAFAAIEQALEKKYTDPSTINRVMKKIRDPKVSNGEKEAELVRYLPRTDALGSLLRELTSAGVYGADGIEVSEAAATAFTDAFLKKNFGDQVPTRGSYDNGIVDQKRSFTLSVPTLTEKPVATCGFQYANYVKFDLGDLPAPPEVKPVDAPGQVCPKH